jgi:toxin ParE1/3/4
VKEHRFHPQADLEYAAAAEYYAQISLELAGRFYDEIEGLIRDIRAHPDRYRIFDDPVRRHLGRVFPYAVLYIERAAEIWIVAVMHLKRQPGYWKDRLS